MFNGQITKFESALSAIDVWLEIATADGLGNEAADIIRSYTQMLSARVQAMHFIEDSNGELYRVMHVDKNVMQREISNPDSKPFVFPIPVPEPVVVVP